MRDSIKVLIQIYVKYKYIALKDWKLNRNLGTMDDFDYEDYDHSSEGMISNFKASIILVSILWVVVIALLLVLLINGSLRSIWLEDPKEFIWGLVALVIILPLLSALGLFFGWYDDKKTAEKKRKLNEKPNFSEIMKSPILYIAVDNSDGEYKENLCSICKEKVGNSTEIVKCPQCKAIFHLHHLEEYLENATNCPICDFEIKK